ncbi:hypothetical protein [Fodinibius sp.]|uniref:hypothetical protein n=1 Tax=Fodinibius sp. TaxID=1872440 RepID=UPI003561381B
MKKTNYYLAGLLVVSAIVIGYHFYAAGQAEEQIIQLIEEQTTGDHAISVKHSSVEVTPFTGKIIIRDLTIILGNHIERAGRLTVDLRYLDVLKFYFGGTEYALKNLNRAEALLLNPSYVNKSTLQQVSSDSIHIHFEGEALDGIRAAVTDTVFGKPQAIRAEGSRLRLQFPNTLVSGLQVKDFQYRGTVAAGDRLFWKEGRHEVTMDSLIWKPFEAFQDKYGFFIKGFGYSTDAIPFQSARFQSTPKPQPGMLQVQTRLKSELALFSADGLVDLQQPLGKSALENATLSITDFSDSFSRVLENVEQLLSISLPRSEDGITIRIEGSISEPVINR